MWFSVIWWSSVLFKCCLGVFECVRVWLSVVECVWVCVSVVECVWVCLSVFECVLVCLSVCECVWVCFRVWLSVVECVWVCLSVFECMLACLSVCECVWVCMIVYECVWVCLSVFECDTTWLIILTGPRAAPTHMQGRGWPAHGFLSFSMDCFPQSHAPRVGWLFSALLATNAQYENTYICTNAQVRM